jgi:hypothetical protein
MKMPCTLSQGVASSPIIGISPRLLALLPVPSDQRVISQTNWLETLSNEEVASEYEAATVIV